jgi:hypothetical protein
MTTLQRISFERIEGADEWSAVCRFVDGSKAAFYVRRAPVPRYSNRTGYEALGFDGKWYAGASKYVAAKAALRYGLDD